MTSCRICDTEISPFMSFGNQPIANGFLTPEQYSEEKFFELAPAFCHSCGMVQIIDQPPASDMFHDNYAFFSKTSRYMVEHFRRFAEQVRSGPLAGRDDPFIVELGSNDGIMLGNFAAAGCRHLGVEPSANVADVARRDGINTLCAFFDEDLAERIVREHGHADAVLAANVMCHIPDLPMIARGIRRLMRDDGVLMFEDPYLGDVIEKTSYDQLYDEHVFLFSVTSTSRAFAAAGLELVDAEPQITHGGSMRYTFAPAGSRTPTDRVEAVRAKEIEQGLDEPETYARFRVNCEKSKTDLLALLDQLKDEKKRVVGYGATSKSTTVINYCGITPNHIEFISDTTPIKQGKFTPGAHIPVLPYEHFVDNPPEYALLFAWNHKTEIMEKEKEYTAKGGKWIVYVPRVEVI